MLESGRATDRGTKKNRKRHSEKRKQCSQTGNIIEFNIVTEFCTQWNEERVGLSSFSLSQMLKTSS